MNVTGDELINSVHLTAIKVKAGPDGNYAYDTLEDIEEINSVEIDLPYKIEAFK